VSASGEVVLSGKLASVVEAGASVVVRHQTDEFAKNLAALFEPEPGATAPAELSPQREAAGGRWYHRGLVALRKWLRVGSSAQAVPEK
jgi:hypothetical protein